MDEVDKIESIIAGLFREIRDNGTISCCICPIVEVICQSRSQQRYQSHKGSRTCSRIEAAIKIFWLE